MTDAVDRIAEALDAIPVVPLSEEEWRAQRRLTIGGSDAPALIGVSRWRTALEVWLEKLEKVEGGPSDTEAAAWGRNLERAILDHYAETAPGFVIPRPGYLLLRSSTAPHAHVTPDAVVVEGPTDGPGLVEVKTVSAWAAREWDHGGVPIEALIQVQHAFAAFPTLRWAHIVGLIGGQRCVIRRVVPHPGFIAELCAVEMEFAGHVVARTPPAMLTANPALVARALTARWPGHLPGRLIRLESPEVLLADALLGRVDEALGRLGKLKVEAQNVIREALGDAEAGLLPDGTWYRWKTEPKLAHIVPASTPRVLRRRAARGIPIPVRMTWEDQDGDDSSGGPRASGPWRDAGADADQPRGIGHDDRHGETIPPHDLPFPFPAP